MKYFLLMIFLLSIYILSQDKNKITTDKNSEPMLTGYCTREAFNDSAFAWWFNSGYENYETDSSSINLLRETMEDVDITIVMGTWCDDTRQHIPGLYKILDEINYPQEQITLIAVNEDHYADVDEIKGLAIDLIPTIIFYRNDSELGRIIEMPDESLEGDMLEIISEIPISH